MIEQCAVVTRQTFQMSDFSVFHRGAAMMFLEHTKRSYKAAMIMGAGMRLVLDM
jgi:hypothetical protein